MMAAPVNAINTLDGLSSRLVPLDSNTAPNGISPACHEAGQRPIGLVAHKLNTNLVLSATRPIEASRRHAGASVNCPRVP